MTAPRQAAEKRLATIAQTKPQPRYRHWYGDTVGVVELLAEDRDFLVRELRAAWEALEESEQSNTFKVAALEAAFAQRDEMCAKWQDAEKRLAELSAAPRQERDAGGLSDPWQGASTNGWGVFACTCSLDCPSATTPSTSG